MPVPFFPSSLFAAKDVRTVKPREPHIDNDDVPAILVIRHAEPTEPTESCSARTSLLFPEDGGPEQYLSQEFRRLLEELLQQHMREVSRVELELEALRRTGPAPDTEVGKEASWEASWDRSSGRSCRSGNSPTESAHRAGSPTAGSPALNTGKRKRRTSQGPELHASELLGVWEADESAEADVEKFFKGKSSSGVSKALLDNVSEESKTSSVLAYEYSRKSRIEKLRDWLQSNQYESRLEKSPELQTDLNGSCVCVCVCECVCVCVSVWVSGWVSVCG